MVSINKDIIWGIQLQGEQCPLTHTRSQFQESCLPLPHSPSGFFPAKSSLLVLQDSISSLLWTITRLLLHLCPSPLSITLSSHQGSTAYTSKFLFPFTTCQSSFSLRVFILFSIHSCLLFRFLACLPLVPRPSRVSVASLLVASDRSYMQTSLSDQKLL